MEKSNYSIRISTVVFGFLAGKKCSVHVYDDRLQFRFFSPLTIKFSDIASIDIGKFLFRNKYTIYTKRADQITFVTESYDSTKCSNFEQLLRSLSKGGFTAKEPDNASVAEAIGE